MNWNGQPRPTSVFSTSTLQASISAADVAKSGTATPSVTNPGGLVSNFVFFPVTRRSATIAMAGKLVFPNCGAAVAGDFNNDGKLDVAWADASSPTVNISLGNGKGAPPSASLTPVSLSFPTQLVGSNSPVQNATLTNTGSLTVNITKIAVPLPLHQTNNCPAA